jgi:hypothetical protein
MMQPDWHETVKAICFEIFEQLAFMFGEELDKNDVQSPEDEFTKATMTFSGHRCGSMDIIVPTRLAPTLAYNILGIDESDPMDSGIAEDALRELLNTLCGRMLPALFTDVDIFDLHPPEIEAISHKQWQQMLDHQDSVVFAIEDSPILINIHFLT